MRIHLLAAIFFCTGSQAFADDVADFYKDNTVSMIVSSSPGGGYDVLSRAVARHLGDHIPGHPNVIVQNMPGAGGIVATNYIAKIAEKDGTVIAGVQNNAPFEPLLGTKEVQYDANVLNWLGTPSVETGLLIVWHTSPIHKLEDAKTIPMTVGASGANSAPAFYARLLNELFHLKIQIIPGFPGQNEAYLAMERGELDGYGVTFWSSLTSTKSQWLREKKVRILVQYGPHKEVALPDVPYGPDLLQSDSDRQLFEAAYAPLAAGRPFVAPPDVPRPRLDALRRAMIETFKDPAFVAEAKKLNLIVDKPTSGEQLQEQIGRVYKMPQPIIDRLRRIAQKYK